MEDALFVATAIRLAQSMGLHQENNIPNLDSTREQRRQIWWHLVWLDIQSSLASGLPTCLGNSALGGVQMISAPERSVVKLLAIGRYEAARLQNQLMHQFQNTATRIRGQISQETVKDLLEAARSFGHLIDNLIVKIPEFEDPQHLFPDSLTKASPETHIALYQDQGDGPTLIGAWSRTSLFLLKLEVAIMLRKLLLGPPTLTSSHGYWNRYVAIFYLFTLYIIIEIASNDSTDSVFQFSLVYLRKTMCLCKSTAFEPYAWFVAEYYGPQQSALLISVYLIHNRGVEDENLARYTVDRYLEFMTETSDKKPLTQTAIDVLVGLCKETDTHMNDHGALSIRFELENDFRAFHNANLWDLVIDDSAFGLRGVDQDS
jgi:hypothetical protein